MDNTKNYISTIFMVIIACAGIIFGTAAAQYAMSFKKELITIKTSDTLYLEPQPFAKQLPLKSKAKLQVIEKVDYAKLNQGNPTMAYVSNSTVIKDEATKKQYNVQPNSIFKVVSVGIADVRVEAKTDNNEVVQFNIPNNSVTILDQGVWKKLQVDKSQTAWLPVEK